MVETNKYKEVFKSTFLFSLVRVIQIIIGIIRNKIIALTLGAEGIGVISVFINVVNLIQSGAGLGISRSAIKDISEANATNDNLRISRTISLTTRIVFFTCLLGCILTILFSKSLSVWTFGSTNYTISFIWLSVVVALNIISEGQIAILSGMRMIRAVAKSSTIGSFIGLLFSAPLYIILGENGIVPSLIITGISSLLLTNYFVRKIPIKVHLFSYKEIYKESSLMIKMGIALMFVGFLGLLFDLLISSYIRLNGGLTVLGYYKAGNTIITSYFGIILTAMTTDYYPRISAVHNIDEKIEIELNKQTEVGLILIYPIALLFVYFSPFFISLLYAHDFVYAIFYTDYAILGTLVIVCSNSLGMILLAKQSSKIFITYSLIHQALFLFIYIYFFDLYGLYGLGVSYFINSLTQLLGYYLIIRYNFRIVLSNKILLKLFIILISVFLAIKLKEIENVSLKYLLSVFLFVFAFFYSINNIKNTLDFKISSLFLKKVK